MLWSLSDSRAKEQLQQTFTVRTINFDDAIGSKEVYHVSEKTIGAERSALTSMMKFCVVNKRLFTAKGMPILAIVKLIHRQGYHLGRGASRMQVFRSGDFEVPLTTLYCE